MRSRRGSELRLRSRTRTSPMDTGRRRAGRHGQPPGDPPLHRPAGRSGIARDAMRGGAVGAVEVGPAAGRHRDRRRQGPAREARGADCPTIPGSKAAPVFLVFCGNNRRHRLLFEWRERPFVNDYLDPFFNASVDAGIVLATFIAAADRGRARGPARSAPSATMPPQVSDILSLPHHVFPVAALGAGWPSFAGRHEPAARPRRHDPPRPLRRERARGEDRRLRQAARGGAALPHAALHREVRRRAPSYGWSEDKARQYSVPERADFGAFVRRKGFKLD